MANLNTAFGYDKIGQTWDTKTGKTWDTNTDAGKANWQDWLSNANNTDIANWNKTANIKLSKEDALGLLNPAPVVKPVVTPTSTRQPYAPITTARQQWEAEQAAKKGTFVQPGVQPGVQQGGSVLDTLTPLLSTYGKTNPSAPGSVEMFQPNLYPYSGSENKADSQGFSNSTGANTSESLSQQFAGIDFNNDFIKSILPMLQESIADLPGYIDQYTKSAASDADAGARMQVNQAMPQVLNSLANRGILNSSVSKTALSDVLSQIAEQSAQKRYTAGMKAAEMKMNIPNILAQLAELGRTSVGSSTSKSEGTTSSTGANTSSSQGQSINVNPLEPYQLIRDMLLGSM